MKDSIISIIEKIDFNKEFVIDNINKKSYTYSDFFIQAISIAEDLKRYKSDDVIIILENSYVLALLYFAGIFTDKRVVVIDPKKGKEEIESILSELTPSVIITNNIAQYDLKNHTKIDIDIKTDDSNEKEYVKDHVIQRIRERMDNQPYLVTYTSGTSGLPKGVEHSLKNLLYTAVALDEKVQKRGGVFLHVMPMTYMAGILNSLFYPFIIGAKIVIVNRFSIAEARKFWDYVIDFKADIFWLSPSMLMMINQMDRGNKGECYCKDHELTFLVGTAPLTNETRYRFQSRYGVDVYASYGLSETLFVSVETKKSQARSDTACVGEILNGIRYKFTDVGEILIDADWMYLRYTNKNTADYFDGTYYKSGDLADIRDNCLYITGRSKDLIIKGGMNVSPGLIEECVYRNSNILENVVLGVLVNGEERICCVYTTSEKITNKDLLENEIKKSVIVNLGQNYAIDYLWNVKEIPRNINGKVDKNIIRSMWEQEHGKKN